MNPQNQNEHHDAPDIHFDLAHFPPSLERAEKMLLETRRLIDGNETVSVAHLQRVHDTLFDLISHADSLHLSSKDLYAKMRQTAEEEQSHQTQQELVTARKRVKALQKKVNNQKMKIKKLKRRISHLQVPLESADKLWFPMKTPGTDVWPDTGAWSCVSIATSPASDNEPWGVYDSEESAWAEDTLPEKWEDANDDAKSHESWVSPDRTWEVPEPSNTCDFLATDICYTLQPGVEAAKIHAKCDSAFVAFTEDRECRINCPAFAQMVDEHAVVPCKFHLYSALKLGETCDNAEVTYFGFHYPDGTTLPYLPVQNVKLVYHDGVGNDGSLDQRQNPWTVCDARIAVQIEMSERVLYQIERNAIEALHESILSGVEEFSDEYYRLKREGCTLVQGPEVEFTRDGRAHLIVDLNRQCYVRRTAGGKNETLGSLHSIMKEKRSDLEAKATFFVRVVRRKESNGVPIVCLKLNSVLVDGHELTL